MKKILTILALTLIFTGCDSAKTDKKTTDGQAIPPLGQQPQQQTQPTQQPQSMAPHSVSGSKVDRKIVVPDTVKGKWSSVQIEVKNKQTSKVNNITASLHSEISVPDSSLKIKIGEFLPAFTMSDVITSASNELKNPAIHITVFENGKEIFKGWLYQNFPEIHPFEHDKYNIVLKGAIAKK